MKKKLLFLTALATTALLITGCQHQIKADSRTTNFKTTAVKKKTKKIDLILKHRDCKIVCVRMNDSLNLFL
ncbi:MAG: hypothetical protein MSH35_09505 [Lactobacillus amylovorus]|nr:hypothetical protein [Lactobacillus amylovorus]MDY2787035.1 hypothetical protein [Lactobacillus amylovorus]MDY4729430.1 hypothetical protein [Lactobacillus amylovorus]